MLVKIIGKSESKIIEAKSCKFLRGDDGIAYAVINEEHDGRPYPVEVRVYVMNDSGQTIDSFREAEIGR